MPLGSLPLNSRSRMSETTDKTTHSLPSTPMLDGFKDAGFTSHQTTSTLLPSAAITPPDLRPRPVSPTQRRKLYKPAPLPSLTKRGPSPTPNPSSFKVPWLASVGTSSVPNSPHVPNHDGQHLHQAMSMSDLKRRPSEPVVSPSSETSDHETDDSFHAHILENYGVELSPEWTGTTAVHDGQTSPPGVSSTTTASSPISQVSRTQSLRSKISLSAMRNNARRRNDSTQTTDVKEETVEVEDMEFTLIRPTITHQLSARDSDDGRESESVHSFTGGLSIPQDGSNGGLQPDRESARSYSPAPSPLSPLSPYERTFAAMIPPPLPSGSGHSELGATRPVSPRSVQSHRQLELKWITAMGAIPSSEAKKNKKIKKLVIDGIPGSVRGVVWYVPRSVTSCLNRSDVPHVFHPIDKPCISL